MNLFAELKRRNVIRMAGLYLVAAWLIIQIAETLLPIFHTPDWVLQAMIVLLALGFIPALIFSWVFELTPEGLKRDAEVDPSRAAAPQTARRMDQLTLAGVLVLLAVIGADRFWPRTQDAAAPAVGNDAAPLTIADPAPAKAPVDDLPSIAVLPFANLSSDPEQEYFSDGMTEELLNVLAKIPGLKVAARTSVFEFKGKGGDVREIGVKLGVSHIVEGSVRRDGDQIRVTAQLIRVADGFHIWSESYDRKLESIFALQDDLAKRVGESLKDSLGLTLFAGARAAINPEAYDRYLQGRALLRSRTELRAAIAHFKAAVELEPTYAAGWSSLSLSAEVAQWYVADLKAADLDAMLDEAAVAAERARAIDPDSAAVNQAIGNVARAQFRYADAERHYLRAMQIDPGYPDVLEDYAELLTQVGRAQDAHRIAQQLVQLDPYFVVGWFRVYEVAVMLNRRDEVVAAARRVQELSPANWSGKLAMLDYAIARDRHDEAKSELAEFANRWPEDARFAQTLLPWALRERELDPASLRAALASAPAGEPSYYLIARGDMAGYNAYVEASGTIAQTFYFFWLNISVPRGHQLMRDPEVKANLRRYGFEAYWRKQGWPPACRPLGESDFECGIDMAGAP